VPSGRKKAFAREGETGTRRNYQRKRRKDGRKGVRFLSMKRFGQWELPLKGQRRGLTGGGEKGASVDFASKGGSLVSVHGVSRGDHQNECAMEERSGSPNSNSGFSRKGGRDQTRGYSAKGGGRRIESGGGEGHTCTRQKGTWTRNSWGETPLYLQYAGGGICPKEKPEKKELGHPYREGLHLYKPKKPRDLGAVRAESLRSRFEKKED